jgi:hypothetical protein
LIEQLKKESHQNDDNSGERKIQRQVHKRLDKGYAAPSLVQ